MYVCMYNYVCIIYLSIVYVFFWGSVSCLKGWPWTWFAAEDDLELMILRLPPECHGYRHAPAHPVCMVLGINPGFVCAGWALHQMNSILSCGFQVTSEATLDSCIWVKLEGSEDTCHGEHKISSLQNWAGLAAGGLGICDCSCTHVWLLDFWSVCPSIFLVAGGVIKRRHLVSWVTWTHFCCHAEKELKGWKKGNRFYYWADSGEGCRQMALGWGHVL